MKKLFTILLTIIAVASYGQLTLTLDVSTIAGTDTTLLFNANDTKYNKSLGLTAAFISVTGMGGTIDFLEGATDTTMLTIPAASYTVNNDTVFIVTADNAPLERYGIKFTKGTVTAGTMTIYYSRKIR